MSEKVPGGQLTQQEKDLLLTIARKSIEARLAGVKMPSPEIGSGPLKEKRGAFVTLKKQARLRGCIGFIEARKPLCEAVEEMAQAAAFSDPRFPPLRKDELKSLHIEISVLTPLKRIQDVSEIEVGHHGIYMVKGFHSGLLLPQVAAEYNWDRTTFLRETCRKAGLEGNAWEDPDTQIFIFSAQVFSEE